MKQILYTCIIIVLNSCNGLYNSDDFDKEGIIKEIEVMLSDYHADINKNGLTAEFTYLDKSQDFFWAPPGYTSALNYDSVQTILLQNAKSLKLVKFQWDTLKIFPLSNKIANYTGIVNGITIDTVGVESKVSIIESGTIIKRSNGWKLLNGQSAILNVHDKK